MDEQGALTNLEASNTDGGLDAARAAEESPDDSFVSTVSNSKKKSSKKKLKLAGRFAPAFAIILIATVGLIVSFFSGSMMPFAVVSRMIEEFNTVGISSVVRSDNLLDLQLSTTNEETLGLTDYQRTALKDQGLLVTEYNGSYVIGYQRPNKKYAVVVTTALAGDTGATSAIAELFPDDAQPSFDPNNTIVTPEDAMNDSSFSTPFTTAAKLWRNGIAGWYDSTAALASSVHGYSRSRWAYYVANGVDDIVQQFAKIASSNLDSASTGTAVEHPTGPNGEELQFDESGRPILDADGNYLTVDGDVPVPPTDVTTQPPDIEGSATGSDTLKQLDLAGKFISGAQTATNVSCVAVEGLISLQTVLSAYNRLNGVNAASGFIEATQLAQYNQIIGGSSSGADPMREYTERLQTVDPETGKTAMQSQGIGSLMSGDAVDSNNSSILANNTEKLVSVVSEDDSVLNVVGDLMNGGAGLVRAMTFCNYTKGALAAVSATVSAVSLGLSIATAGISNVLSATFGTIVKTIITAAVTAAIPIIAEAVVSKLVEYLGDQFTKDAATEWFGPELGDLLVSRSNTILGANAQTGGQSPGSAEKVAAYKSAQTAVLAREAEYERATHSPLDPSSRYTFLGSLVYAAIPFAASPQVSSALTSLGNLTRNSLTALLPSASAVSETNMVGQAKKGDCPLLDSISVGDSNFGIQGDIFCNPLMIEDYATDSILASTSGEIYTTLASTQTGVVLPESAFEWELGHNYIKESGNTYVINDEEEKNELKYYMIFCGQRVSNWGIADANITSALEEEQQSSAHSILSMIPIIGDVVTLVDAARSEKNLPWTTGSACVASDDNPYWNGSKGHNKIHQAFMASDRWMENTALSEESIIASYLKSYYDKNPLDNSYTGILARYSGMSKDNVIATLDLMEGLIYLAKYHPSDRAAPEKMAKTFHSREEIMENERPTLAFLGQKIRNTIEFYRSEKDPKPATPRFQVYALA